MNRITPLLWHRIDHERRRLDLDAKRWRDVEPLVPYAPCPRLVELVEQGRLGDKTGGGVYGKNQPG